MLLPPHRTVDPDRLTSNRAAASPRDAAARRGGGPTAGIQVTCPQRLSRREREILPLLAARWTDREIADALCISYRTVTTHVAHILAKLGIDSRRAVAAFGPGAAPGDRPGAHLAS